MNCALIFAGGTGQRMHSKAVPKQFLQVHGKPIIIHTLEIFEKHRQVDHIIVVCLASWIDYLRDKIAEYSITKVCAVVPGGETGQDSIFNGLNKLHELYPDDSVVLIHDGVRPLIDADTISRNIACVHENGNAITVSPALETIAVSTESSGSIDRIIERKSCMLAKAPQSFYLKDIYEAHLKARAQGEHNFIDSAYLMQWNGHNLHTVDGPIYNIKITTPMDYYVFRAILDAKENAQINGIG